MKIALLGDVALNGLFVSESERNLLRFKDVIPVLRDCDAVFANLEAPLRGEGGVNERKTQSGGIIHYSDIDVFNEVLPALNISAVSLANNHIYDYKTEGVKNTIECLGKMGIAFTGAGLHAEHAHPVIIERNNYKIGFMAYVHGSTNPKIPEDSDIYINYFDEEKICKDLEDLRERCDYIIVSIHWGVDYSSFPTKYQRQVSKKLVETGANVIHGHHTHVLQPYERYKQGIVFYSLGSFCHGDFYKDGKLRSLMIRTKKSMIALIDPNTNTLSSVPTRELKGNKITIRRTKGGFSQFALLNTMKLKHSNKVMDYLIDLKEVFFDRLYDYFFGYYRNPTAQLFSLRGLRKIGYFLTDYRKIRSKK